MNPNELMAQQQALLNQALQNQQHLLYGYIAVSVGLFLIGAWVIYMFYARLRGIEDELRKFRIAYEFANTPSVRLPVRPSR